MTTPASLTDRATAKCDPSVTPLPKRGNEVEVECHSKVCGEYIRRCSVCLENKDILPPCRNDASHRRHPRCVASAI